MDVRKNAGEVELFWLGFESAKMAVLIIDSGFINGTTLNQLGYPIK